MFRRFSSRRLASGRGLVLCRKRAYIGARWPRTFSCLAVTLCGALLRVESSPRLESHSEEQLVGNRHPLHINEVWAFDQTSRRTKSRAHMKRSCVCTVYAIVLGRDNTHVPASDFRVVGLEGGFDLQQHSPPHKRCCRGMVPD